jgi:histidine triad (HIT) family protein
VAASPGCIFCKILKGEIPSTKVYEDADLFAFRDINAQAPNHVLVIPREHLASVDELRPENAALGGKLLMAGAKIAKQLGTPSYRLVLNTGAEAGQTVFHIHLHVLSGRKFGWPPG